MNNLKEDLLKDAIWWLDNEAVYFSAPDEVYMIRKEFGWRRDEYNNPINYAYDQEEGINNQECLFNLLIIEALNE